MPQVSTVIEQIDFDKVYLDQENPRHEEYQSQKAVIEYLCGDELVFQLAKDIKAHGLNPLEIFALVPENNDGTNDLFIIAEGNRRACALKLLNDPDLAPSKYKKEFMKLASGWTQISEVPAIRFPDKESVKIWLDRIHGGLQGGIGRKTWNAEQKSRFTGDQKNKLAQIILDYAEEHKFITEKERKGRLTTASRYLSNAIFRENIGIDNSNAEDICRTRPQEDFDIMLQKFISDLVENKTVTSRSNKIKIDEYSRKLSTMDGVSTDRVTATSLFSEDGDRGEKGKKDEKPKQPKKARTIKCHQEISSNLETLGIKKLESLYHSLCTVNLEQHTPLLAVGAWSFIESLTALMGRGESNSDDFVGFLKNDRLAKLGFNNKKKRTILRDALARISKSGNTTKHHEVSANFYGQQLANDMETLEPLFLKCIEEAIGAKNEGKKSA